MPSRRRRLRYWWWHHCRCRAPVPLKKKKKIDGEVEHPTMDTLGVEINGSCSRPRMAMLRAEFTSRCHSLFVPSLLRSLHVAHFWDASHSPMGMTSQCVWRAFVNCFSGDLKCPYMIAFDLQFAFFPITCLAIECKYYCLCRYASKRSLENFLHEYIFWSTSKWSNWKLWNSA